MTGTNPPTRRRPVMSEFVVRSNAGAKPGVREAMWGEL